MNIKPISLHKLIGRTHICIHACDEFIFYDDLVGRAGPARKKKAKAQTKKKKSAMSEDEKRRQDAIDMVMATLDDIFEERGDGTKVWGSMIKQTLKRRQPGFSERYHGFQSFGDLLEEAASRGLLQLQHDEKSGGYIVTGTS